jgi:N-acetylmuramoyl-L-alanine amidase
MRFRIKNSRLSVVGTSNVDFVGGALTPKFLIIHYTASGPSADIARYFSQSSANVSAHLVVGAMAPSPNAFLQAVAWHAGGSQWIRNGTRFSGLNSNSIGIEIKNWGPLHRSGGSWVSWTGVAVDGSKLIEARHKFGVPDGNWEIFTDAQIETVVAAAQAICGEFDIQEILGHDRIAPGRKSAPGPAWDMNAFKARVRGEADLGDAVMVGRSSNGLNIRQGPGASFPTVRKILADGTKVMVHEASGKWRYVSVLTPPGSPIFRVGSMATGCPNSEMEERR